MTQLELTFPKSESAAARYARLKNPSRPAGMRNKKGQGRSVCVVKNCGRVMFAHGYCSGHYYRIDKYGDAREDIPIKKPVSFAERFWSKVDIKGEDECWHWKAGGLRAGYGQFFIRKVSGTPVTSTAPRMAMLLSGKALDDNQMACHTCDNPACCNPKHLFAGDATANMQDCSRKGRKPHGENHPWTKLSTKQVEEIKQRRQFGEKLLSIASAFGIGIAQVSRIANGIRRKLG